MITKTEVINLITKKIPSSQVFIENIRIMSPNSNIGKEAYKKLIQLGFVDTKYKG